MPSHREKPATKSRFELPALDLNFGSITDGTNIPPPPASPITRSATPPHKHTAANDSASGASGYQRANGNGNSPGRNEPLASPTKSAREGSIRRLFSRNKLNNEFAAGELPTSQSAPVLDSERPQSRSGFSLMGDRKSKRSSGWFKRLRTGDQQSSRRSSFLFGQSSASSTKPAGPPPPMIPELKEIEKDDGSLGADIFKDVRSIN